MERKKNLVLEQNTQFTYLRNTYTPSLFVEIVI